MEIVCWATEVGMVGARTEKCSSEGGVRSGLSPIHGPVGDTHEPIGRRLSLVVFRGSVPPKFGASYLERIVLGFRIKISR